MKTILMFAALGALVVLALCRVIPAATREARRKLAGRGVFVVLVIAAVAIISVFSAQKPTIDIDRFVKDAGCYVTNDVVHIELTNAADYALFDFTDSWLLVYRREQGQTNATDWVECLPRRKYGNLPADWVVPGATNYNYLVVIDYVPPSPVHTNGVFEMRGFKIIETDAELGAGFINSNTKTEERN